MVSAHEYDTYASDIRRASTVRANGEIDAKELVRYATLAASSHNTQPWKFKILPDSVQILPDYSRRCPVVDPDDSHLFKSLGCAAENMILAAAAQGFSADVRFEPEHDALVVELKPVESIQASDLFHAIPKRQCTKLAYDGSALDESELRKLKESGNGLGVRTIFLLSDKQMDAVVDFVTRGNTAQLSDAAFRDELVSWIRFNPGMALRTGDGLSGRTSGQPSIPTWLARWIMRLVLTPDGQAKTDAANIKSSAGIAVFVSDRDDKVAWAETGRAFQRFALQAAALDIRTAFINQPIEVRSLRPEFESWLGLDGEFAQLMVRFGHGPMAPFSLRRPVENVIISDHRK
jgi:hypothetical protein